MSALPRISQPQERAKYPGEDSSPTDARKTRTWRICVVAPSLDILGGQSRQAVRLIEGLRCERSISVAFLPHNPRLPGPLRILQGIKYVRTAVTTLAYLVLLFTRLGRYDVIHVFSASYYSYLLSVIPAILIGRLYGKRIILNYRSGEADDHLRNWKLTAIPVMRLAHRIIVPSGYLVDVFAKYGLRAQPIYNVVELDSFAFRERVPTRPAFLTTRLHEPLYNVPCVLKAFALIQKTYPDASLTVGGDGWMRPQLEALAKTLGLRNTTFVGRVPFDRMPALYNAADIYLTATNLDNMPGSVIECLACGLPVVTTDAGGIPYIVQNERTALLVPLGDFTAMAESALRLLGDAALVQRISHAGRESCKRFTWPAVRDQWLQVYRDLLEGGTP